VVGVSFKIDFEALERRIGEELSEAFPARRPTRSGHDGLLFVKSIKGLFGKRLVNRGRGWSEMVPDVWYRRNT